MNQKEVCVLVLFFLRQDGMGLGVTSRIAGTGTGLHISGLVARDNFGKIQDGTGPDYSVPLGKFLNDL